MHTKKIFLHWVRREDVLGFKNKQTGQKHFKFGLLNGQGGIEITNKYKQVGVLGITN